MNAINPQPIISEDDIESEESKFLLPPLIIAMLAVWILPMVTSLELDETGVWWVIKDGLLEAMTRARVWPLGQSLIYDSVLVATRAILGGSDFAMRVPSVLAMIGALYLLYRLGERLLRPVGAMLACVVFVTMREVVYDASTMRPYALVPLFTIGAVLALLNWLDGGRVVHAAAYVLLCVLAVYTNYFAALMLPVHAALAFRRLRDGTTRIHFAQLVTAGAAILALLTPLFPFLLDLRASRVSYSYLPNASVQDLASALAPPLVAGGIALPVLLFLMARLPLAISLPRANGQLWFLAAWALLPSVILFVVSTFTKVQVFAPRYFICSAPAVALLAGALLRVFEPRAVRLTAALAIVAGAVLVFGVDEGAMRGATDWRGAARAVREGIQGARTPVVAVPSFHEGATVEGALNPAITDAVFAPYLRYDFGGILVRVPQSLTPEAEDYLNAVVKEKLAGQREFVVVGMAASEPYREWFRGRSASLGFTWHWLGNFGGVGVSLFTRNEITR